MRKLVNISEEIDRKNSNTTDFHTILYTRIDSFFTLMEVKNLPGYEEWFINEKPIVEFENRINANLS
jgi:hypothetical protein